MMIASGRAEGCRVYMHVHLGRVAVFERSRNETPGYMANRIMQLCVQ